VIDEGLIRIDTKEGKSTDPMRVFGGFEFRSPVWREKKLIYTKAADDLIGAFAIVSLASVAGSENFLGLLTRAEEVGLVGALAHFDLNWLKEAQRPIVVVSLETSRALPGAEIGKGPVVRQGDRSTTFDPASLQLFSSIAEKALPKKFQRRVMDGGTCEATAAVMLGYSAIGISVPLGNYHNQSFEGGPDSAGPNGPAPEFVHWDDLIGMLTLGRALLEKGLPWADPWREKRKSLYRALREYTPLLKSYPIPKGTAFLS